MADKIKRFELVSFAHQADMEEDPDGEYVKYSDYAALESLLLDARAERQQTVADMDEQIRHLSNKFSEERIRAKRAEALAASNQAKIDALMLEYCPDEMTQAQRDEWARHQAPDDTAIDAVGGRGER